MYRVLEYFTDLKDNSYSYKEGDTYPRKGYEPSAERIEELATDKNVRKRPIIELIAASKKAVVDEVPAIADTEEKPKKRARAKKD